VISKGKILGGFLSSRRLLYTDQFEPRNAAVD